LPEFPDIGLLRTARIVYSLQNGTINETSGYGSKSGACK
jgi:hypothetical protein